MKQPLKRAVKYWEYLAPIVKCPSNQKEYNEVVVWLDELLELVGENENHKLIGLVDVMSAVIASYEESKGWDIPAKGVDALRYLIECHHLRQSDLPEIGSQGVVSEILQGKRSLNVRQVKLLAKRFHVDPATFLDD